MENGPNEQVGFHGDPPIAVSLVICDSVAIGIGTNKLTLQGLFDNVFAGSYPVAVAGAVLLSLQGVIEPVELRFYAVAYHDGFPLGEHQLIGVSTVEPQPDGRTISAFIAGTIIFPAKRAGRADILVRGNGVYLAHRRVDILDVPQPPGAPQV